MRISLVYMIIEWKVIEKSTRTTRTSDRTWNTPRLLLEIADLYVHRPVLVGHKNPSKSLSGLRIGVEFFNTKIAISLFVFLGEG